MTTIELLDPILSGGIRNVNFFNGRLLSAEDLSREQQASRERHAQLGRAIGEGIAYGLEVSKTPGVNTKAVVTIAPGLAINREGRTLRLSSSTDLSLIRDSNGSGSSDHLTFNDCAPFQTGVYVAGAGVYLLTIAPAEGREGRALVSGLGNEDAACNSKYIVDGVRFRLVQIDLTQIELSDVKRLRNLVAHKCFGVSETVSFLTDLLGAPKTLYGLVDTLRPARLTECDVPLAILYWTDGGGISFIDLWSVRRRLTRVAVTGRWESLGGNRRTSEAEAMLLQLSEQMIALNAAMTPAERAAARVEDHFVFLPAAGVLPVGTGGFDPTTFFGARMRGREVILHERQVRALLRVSLDYEPINVGSQERVHVFLVQENQAAPADVQRYGLFASSGIVERFHVPVSIRRGSTALGSTVLTDLFSQTAERYRALQSVISAGSNVTTAQFQPLDNFGLLAIEEVITLAHVLHERARARALTQESAITSFTALADAQQRFTQTYLERIFPANPRYTPSFQKLVAAVDELLKRTVASAGINGLFKLLRDFDLISASATQRAINQNLELQVSGTARGNVDVRFVGVAPSTFNEHDIVNFQFEIRTRANVDETYDLVPVLTAEREQLDWDARLQFLTASLEPLAAREIRLPKEGSVIVILQVQGVPPGTRNSSLRLRLIVRSKNNPTELIGTSGEEMFVVGQQTTPPASDIHLTFAGVEGNGRTDSDGRVLVTAGSSGAVVILDAIFERAGIYDVSAAIPDAAGAADWQIQLLAPVNPSRYDVRSEPLPALKKIRIGLRPLSVSAQAITLAVRVVDATDSAHLATFNQPVAVG